MAEPKRSLELAFLADQSALVRRFVLAEILGPPRSRAGALPASAPRPVAPPPARPQAEEP